MTKQEASLYFKQVHTLEDRLNPSFTHHSSTYRLQSLQTQLIILALISWQPLV